MNPMTLARRLVLLCAAIFGATGLLYLVAPGAMLAVTGATSSATTDFLLRTEGVALLCGAGVLWAVHDGTARQLRLALVALSGYLVLGSFVDLAALTGGVVGTAAVPSATVRIVLGGVCVFAATRLHVEHRAVDVS